MATLGTYAAGSAGGRALDSAATHGGFRFTAPVGGTISQVKVDTVSSTGSGNWTAELWSDNAGVPGVLVGTPSNVRTVTTSGAQTFTFGTPPAITAGLLYWIILKNPATNSWSVDTCTNDASYGSGRNNTITSITATGLPSTEDWRMEVTYTAVAAKSQGHVFG